MIQELEDVILTCDFPEQGLIAEQESEELGDEVIARLNPKTGEIENLEVLFFSGNPRSNPSASAGLAASVSGRSREPRHRNRNGRRLCDRDQELQQAQRAKAELAREFLNECLGPEGSPEFRDSGNSRGMTYAAHRSIAPTSRISSFSVLT